MYYETYSLARYQIIPNVFFIRIPSIFKDISIVFNKNIKKIYFYAICDPAIIRKTYLYIHANLLCLERDE